MKKRRILLVDGYNVLGARSEMTPGSTLEDARHALIRRMHNYAGLSGQQVILVFDAWQGDRSVRSEDVYSDGFTVVYTRHGETADNYIEHRCDEYARDMELGRCEVRVATSDAVEQTVVMGRGAIRISSRELLYEMETARTEGAPFAQSRGRSTVMDHLPQDVREKLERMRRKK